MAWGFYERGGRVLQEKRLGGRQLVRDVAAKSKDLSALVAVAEALWEGLEFRV